ncbi:hypothetical protein [Virgibacillus siamensis]|uniref:hypothetical protein n=1 Tax=Virgibacillus siamensis TaxID=480071 RepID=UPI000986CD74|nr:hypothetical protein [Virgibacillus siamensis]
MSEKVEMNLKLAFIGIEEMKPILDKIAVDFPELTMRYYFYELESEALAYTLQAEKENDVILYGGPTPYEIVTKQHNHTIKKPVTFISYDGSALYYGMLKVFKMMDGVVSNISFDTIPDSAIQQIFSDLNMNCEQYRLYNHSFQSSKLVQFHKKMIQEQGSCCAVTCLKSSYLKLKDHVPCVLAIAPESAVRQAVQQSILLCQSERFRQSQIVAGVITVTPYTDFDQDYMISQKQLEIHHVLLSYANNLHAALFSMNNFKFVFYTTMGMLKKADRTLFYTFTKDLRKVLNSEIALGFGVGTTAQTAQRRANIALKYCKQANVKESCFIITDEERIINVLQQSLSEDWFRSESKDLSELSEVSGISQVVLMRISKVIQKLDKTTYTAEELGDELSQTPRNARRILKQLEDKGLANLVGNEHYSARGRPKSVYDISFLS